MKLLLKIISVIMLWGVVIYMILYIEPETVKDIGLEGMYTPFWAIVTIATWYTVMLISGTWVMATVVATLVGLALILAFMQLMSLFIAIVMLLIIVFTYYLLTRSETTNDNDHVIK